jgi:hypothetical protein
MLPPKKWGGRAKRFTDYKLGVRRSVDPFAESHEQIRSPLEDEHWTVQRFRPDVSAIFIYPPVMQIVMAGKRTIRAQPSLLVTRKDGNQELHLVLRYPEHESRISGCQTLSRHLRAALVVVTVQDVRRNKQLLRDLDYLQRCATRQLDDLERPDAAVLAHVAERGVLTVGDARRAHSKFDKESIDAALAVGHLEGALTIHFNEGQFYDDRTVICATK